MTDLRLPSPDLLLLAQLQTVCRFSGLSGLMYALPLLSHNRMTVLGKLSWVLQAVLSILADYTYIGHSSPIHGIDRYLATFNCFRVIAVGVDAKLWLHVVLAPIPLAFHLFARIAKVDMNEAKDAGRMEDFEGHKNNWVVMHGWWHVTGALLIFLMYESEMRLWLSRKSPKKLARGKASEPRAKEEASAAVAPRGRRPKQDKVVDGSREGAKSKSRERSKSKTSSEQKSKPRASSRRTR
jgi:hypothetical protein